MVEDEADDAAAADEQASWVNPTDFVTCSYQIPFA